MSVSTLSWTDAPLLGFDTETTGTNVARDRIVTVALVHSVGPGREGETVATWLIDPEMEIPEDRKSTRLNSSHVSISYAVFCLKKKKQQTNRSRRAIHIS